MAYKVLIVDDQAMPRQLFESFVGSSSRYELVASVETAKVAYAYCAGMEVDLVLMDVVMNDIFIVEEISQRPLGNQFPVAVIFVFEEVI